MEKVHYKEWKGRNRFLFKGRLMTGSSSDNFTMIFCYSYIILFTIVYNYTLSVYLTEAYGSMYSTLGFFYFGVCFFFQLKTSFTDPGVIPRGSIESVEEAMENGVPLEREDDSGSVQLLDIPSTNTSGERSIDMIPLKGSKTEISLYRFRHCKTCKMMRPPKSSHCNECDNCVKGFDHHCFFVGNCIGKRNHKYFFYFLFFGSLYCFHASIFCILGLFDQIGKNPQLKIQLGNQLECWLIGGFLIIFPFLTCRRYAVQGIRNSLMGIGAVFVLIGLYLGCRGVEGPTYSHPITFILVFVMLAPITLWVFGAFLGCLYVVSLDLTSKEKAVIEREIIDPRKKKHLYTATVDEKIANLKNFFFGEEVESHVCM